MQRYIDVKAQEMVGRLLKCRGMRYLYLPEVMMMM